MIVLFLAVLNAAVFYWITDGILGAWVPILPEIVAAVAFLAVPLAVLLFRMPVTRGPSVADRMPMYTDSGEMTCWNDCGRVALREDVLCRQCREQRDMECPPQQQ